MSKIRLVSPQSIGGLPIELEKGFAFDIETTGLNPKEDVIVGLGLSNLNEDGFYIPIAHSGSGNVGWKQVVEVLGPLFRDQTVPKGGHNAVFDVKFLCRDGLSVNGITGDSRIAPMLLTGVRGGTSLKHLSQEVLGEPMREFSEVAGEEEGNFADVPLEDAAEYGGSDAVQTMKLLKHFRPLIVEAGLDTLYRRIESPLVSVLGDMFEGGIQFDHAFCRDLKQELVMRQDELRQRIDELAGRKVSPSSTDDLSNLLFDEMGLPSEGLKVKQNGKVSTAEGVLRKLSEYEVVQAILDWKFLNTLRTHSVNGYLLAGLGGSIHANFDPFGTVTGRFSSYGPNMQNVPKHTKGMNLQVRQAFVPRAEHYMLAADYSQIEPRVLAELSGDERLTNIFLDGLDVYREVGALLLKKSAPDITKAERSMMKVIVLAIMYGGGGSIVAGNSGCSIDEGYAFVRRFYRMFPGVAEFTKSCSSLAKNLGYVQTMFGRKRFLNYEKDQSQGKQFMLDRLAVNSPIQGSAGELCKWAMVQAHLGLRDMGIRILVQVHDDIVFDVPNSISVEEATERVTEIMITPPHPMRVPLAVSVRTGSNWYELND